MYYPLPRLRLGLTGRWIRVFYLTLSGLTQLAATTGIRIPFLPLVRRRTRTTRSYNKHHIRTSSVREKTIPYTPEASMFLAVGSFIFKIMVIPTRSCIYDFPLNSVHCIIFAD